LELPSPWFLESSIERVAGIVLPAKINPLLWLGSVLGVSQLLTVYESDSHAIRVFDDDQTPTTRRVEIELNGARV
jgi:hypothetical protein